jgi:antitoxin (DNA-binding transcriptional repressor) of toxin-antitoxin stability system
MSKVYTYSEARQRLAQLLDEAGSGEEILIRRRDGSEFVLRSARERGSPLNVPGVDSGLAREEILQALRDSRERDRF